jgi:murein DD-endopeptidase MepM/ murein hydrolase activator NlpD
VKRLAIITLVAVIFATVIAPCAMAGMDIKTAKSKKSTIDSRISELNKDKKAALQEKAALEKKEQALKNQQAAENSAYKDLLNQIKEAEDNLKQTEKALAEAEEIYKQKLELAKIRVKVMYQNSSTSKLETLLSSKSLVEFYERLQYMQIVAENDSEVIEDLNLAKQDVEIKKQQQEEAKAILQLKAQEKEQRIASISASRASVASDLQESNAALKQLEKEIDAQIAKSKEYESLIKKLQTSTKKYTGGTMTWPCPSSYNITSSFGNRKHPILRVVKMHTGIDIGASYGASIVAAASGKVIMSQYDSSGYGRMIVIDHGGGITTLYAHASKLLVSVGDEVKTGQIIAKVGSTGLSTGNHLHFEVRKNGTPVNPLNGYLKK